MLRPCAKSSITIPRDAERKAFEQEAMLNSVYKACKIICPSVLLKLSKEVQRTSVVIFVPFSDLIPHAPNSARPDLLTTANVKPGIPWASAIFCTAFTTSGVRIVVDVPLTADRRSSLAVASTVQ